MISKQFNNDKKQCMHKLKHEDKSKKGSIDKPIIKLVEEINKNPNFYTTSSCSGRVILFSIPKKGKKFDVNWLYVSHNGINQSETAKLLKMLTPNDKTSLTKIKETVYFRYEPLIMHLVAKDMESAQSIMRAANDAGFKHSGIIAATTRIIVEIMGTDRLDVPIAEKNKILISENYFKYLIKVANTKHKNNVRRINLFLKKVKKLD